MGVLVGTYLFSVALMIGLPVLTAVYWRRKVIAPWYLFCAGMAAFVVSQMYHIPLNNGLTEWGVIGPVGAGESGLVRTAVVLGLSAALSEGLARIAAFWLLFRFQKAGRWSSGVMVGLGHGGIEAMLVGGVAVAAGVTSLLALEGADLSALAVSADQLAAIELQRDLLLSGPWMAAIPLLERIMAMSLHVIISVMVWRAFKFRQWGYLVLGLAYHALVDGLLVYLAAQSLAAWQLEGVFLLLLLPGVIWLWRTRDRAELAAGHRVAAVAVEWRLFVTAVRKEWSQQWQTKRVLAVTAVFLLFGLMSPLVARYTPEILGTMEGAEQFADLIPEPTTQDAIAQYVKNITQFGFIIAILVGMGAVAGEKEKGTAAMILSKPMSRWAFLLSKFTAQLLMYALAFLLAGGAAYYYVLVLFEPLSPAAFAWGNVLLWLWLLCFAAVTLLGSTVGKSVGAGAGLSLAGAVGLLLLGSLPKVGAIAPAGLVGWASQLGVETARTELAEAAVAANGGALAGSVALILILLVTALAVFEVQEI